MGFYSRILLNYIEKMYDVAIRKDISYPNP